MGLKEKFEEHHLKDKLLPGTIDRKDMLILYGLYKQAKIGNVNTDRPVLSNGMDIAMWDAWKAVEGKPTDEAMTEYIAKVKALVHETSTSSLTICHCCSIC
ncbi:hypothetical protein DM860_013125 [Cuscuta australis]|uniref:ACB domain-containing protein n=1 Tax=Cuscuta australis TaxID=267555 RepID=A0A328DBA0_9ASTE|nr:hypothetical protein DM860_013125 [Cuscuta australis]